MIGRVQGVGYRAWVRSQARAMGLRGWVRNCPDGAVEAVFAGAAYAVDAMLAACRDGPTMAVVTNVIAHETPAPAGENFEITY